MVIGYVELMHMSFPKYSRMKRGKMKYNEETDKKVRDVITERSKAGKKNTSPDSL